MAWSALWQWLLTPLSGQMEHVIAGAVAWHGRLMVAGWNILVPFGVLIARFFKIAPRQNWPQHLDNKAWWHCHLFMQQTGFALAIVALALLLFFGPTLPEGPVATAHATAGWALLVAGLAQILSGRLRGTKGGPTAAVFKGDHYFMTRRRVMFERFHKSVGWLSMPLTFVATMLGLFLADAPRWMPLVILTWWSLLTFAFVVLQKRGMCIDTYQAIWGADPSLPGNRRKPIGWGIRRYNSNRSPTEQKARQ
ncbi:cytochrome b561 domain-containing protein [Oryzifoliimicrobium ureilyticus]|uniref:cytochrome b561 domain-containing protein n=1 Tax=Oryzifoliimicrobium ureilyticus TaxID=3113724 RepID=UPI0030766028